MSFNPPPLPPQQPNWGQFQVWWQQFLEALKSVLLQIFSAISSMPDIPNETVFAAWNGPVRDGQLPRFVQAYRYTGSTDDTLNASWSFTVDYGDLTGTINNGLLEITALGQTSGVTITSDYNDVQVSKSFVVTKQLAVMPPNNANFGATNEFVSFTGAGPTSIMANPINISTGAGGTIQYFGELLFYTDAAPPTGNFDLTLWWYQSTGGGAYGVRVGFASAKDLIVTALPNGGYLVDAGRALASNGAAFIGLPAFTAYQYKLYVTASPALSQTLYFVGQAGVAGG